SLRHSSGDVDAFPLFRIEVDVEVLGLEHLEIKLLVPHLVAAEILLSCRRSDSGHDNRSRNQRGNPSSRAVTHGATVGVQTVRQTRRREKRRCALGSSCGSANRVTADLESGTAVRLGVAVWR